MLAPGESSVKDYTKVFCRFHRLEEECSESDFGIRNVALTGDCENFTLVGMKGLAMK